jgi:hypothetical protein
MTHPQLAAAFRLMVARFEPVSVERDCLLKVAIALAPAENREAFIKSCGFVLVPSDPS